MKNLTNHVFMLGICLLVLFMEATGLCFQPPGSFINPNMGGIAPVGPPPVCGPGPAPMMPCPPQQPFPRFSYELGARAFYSTNEFKVKFDDNRADIDFIKDLNFARNLLLGEFYAALRLPPVFALTYSFSLPRPDSGYGVIVVERRRF